MQCNAMQCNEFNTIHDTIRYDTIRYNTIQYNTIQYNNRQSDDILFGENTLESDKLCLRMKSFLKAKLKLIKDRKTRNANFKMSPINSSCKYISLDHLII